MNPIAALRRLLTSVRSAAATGSEVAVDAAQRAAIRNRRATFSGITAAAARAIQIGASLLTVPLTIRYLGTERFGLWMTISSFLFMAGFADFGLGNGLLTFVARAHGKDDLDGIRRAISSAFASLAFICICSLAILSGAYRFVSWGDLFRVTSDTARAEAGPALVAFGVCACLSLPAGVVQRAQMGLQQGFITNIWQLAGSILSLVALLICISLHLGLPSLVVAIAGMPLLATVANSIVFFGITRPDLRPSWHLTSTTMIRRIVSIGILFFVLQIVGALAYSADNFVLARAQGAITVPEYAIPQRMFSMVTIMIAMLVSPLWPAYGEAIARGDHRWVRRSVFRSLSWVLLASFLGCTLLLLASRPLIHWWAGATVNPPFFLLVGLALWTVMECCGNALSMFLNGSGLIHFQIAVACVFGVACISAKIYLTRRYGVIGLPWATILTAGLCSYLPLFFYLRMKFHRYPVEDLKIAVGTRL